VVITANLIENYLILKMAKKDIGKIKITSYSIFVEVNNKTYHQLLLTDEIMEKIVEMICTLPNVTISQAVDIYYDKKNSLNSINNG
jgi:hypothetical protein